MAAVLRQAFTKLYIQVYNFEKRFFTFITHINYTDQREVMSLKHIGCFNNFKRHPVISGWSKEHSQLTPQHCVRSCYARRLPYAALVSS